MAALAASPAVSASLRGGRPAAARPRVAAPTRRPLRVCALGPPDNKAPPPKTLKREEEPDQYWQSKLERSGKSPLQDPAAIIGLMAIFLPFVILGIAFAFGLVELPEQ